MAGSGDHLLKLKEKGVVEGSAPSIEGEFDLQASLAG